MRWRPTNCGRARNRRAMGWTTLLVDTVRGNTEMLKLYDSLGFREIERYSENANDPALAPYLTYLACDLRR